MAVFGSLVPLLLLSSDYFRIHHGATLIALIITYGSIAMRGWLIWRGGNLFRDRRSVWLGLKFISAVLPIAMWDIFYCIIAIGQGAETWDALLILLD